MKPPGDMLSLFLPSEISLFHKPGFRIEAVPPPPYPVSLLTDQMNHLGLFIFFYSIGDEVSRKWSLPVWLAWLAGERQGYSPATSDSLSPPPEITGALLQPGIYIGAGHPSCHSSSPGFQFSFGLYTVSGVTFTEIDSFRFTLL